MPEIEQKIRIVCSLSGYEDCWIEYDAARWGLGTYISLWSDLRVNQVLIDFLPQYSIAWGMHNADGTTIVHPGPGATGLVWQTVWDQFSVETSRILFMWLFSSALAAMNEAMSLSPKSLGAGPGDGAGPQGAAERGESGAAG